MSGVILRPQNTAYTFRLGPVLDATDAKTRITDATIAQESRRISKNGSAYAQSSQSGTLEHEANGFYICTLSSADFDTLGSLELDVDIPGCLIAPVKFQVIDVASYLAFQGSGDGLRANVMAINNVSAAAARLAIASAQMYPFTVDSTSFSPTTTEFESADLAVPGSDHWNGAVIIWTSGSLAGQRTRITDYSVVGGRGHFTMVALNAAPSNGSTGLIV